MFYGCCIIFKMYVYWSLTSLKPHRSQESYSRMMIFLPGEHMRRILNIKLITHKLTIKQ